METLVLFRVLKARPHTLFAVLLDHPMQDGAHLIYIYDEPLFYERYDWRLEELTRKATPEEYAPLAESLQCQGFELYLATTRKSYWGYCKLIE